MKPVEFKGLVRSGPKGQLSPTLGDACPVCRGPLIVDDYTTLLLEPAPRAIAGAGSEVHWDCAIATIARPRGQSSMSHE
jgi:hypothetical protein